MKDLTPEIQTEVVGGELSEEEITAYTQTLRAKYSDRVIKRIIFKVDGEFVDTKGVFADAQPFLRIRRITGYLVGTLDKFNDGKKSEERDRVKHTVIE